MFQYDKGIHTKYSYSLSFNRYIEMTIMFLPTMDILLSSYLMTADGKQRGPTTNVKQLKKKIGDTKNIE